VAVTEYFVIWSLEHNAWWRPGEMGYCYELREAGRYPRDIAERIVRRANIVKVNECMIPAPAPTDYGVVFRLRFRQVGGHVHCRLFTAKRAGTTFANCGNVVFDALEWPRVRAALADLIEVLPEEATPQ
jgi:hypothetical protein